MDQRGPSRNLQPRDDAREETSRGRDFTAQRTARCWQDNFPQGVSAALGVDPDEVTSPSFTLVNPHEGRFSLFHIDLYRLDEGAQAAHAVDLDELLTDESSVIVIEWAERMGRYPLPGNVWRVTVSGDGDDPRKISIEAG